MRLRRFLFKSIRKFSLSLVLLVIFIGIGASYGIYLQQQMKREASQFVNITMLDLLATWDDQVFLIHITPELQQNTTVEQLEDMRRVFAHLGELLHYQGAQGGLFRTGQWWWQIVARYTVQATFQRGQFTATVLLIKQQGEWVINGFEYEYTYFPVPRRVGALKLA